ncbi:MAG: RIP metalloprotease RseP [Bacteroidales bacterium]|jgi:regulator of sigma E protease|nr:RIP metalloprotease RseP [Bacteroidales bacterium]MCK9448382.1 RIP metalloprotease RseP [Bacteroidales bacterium]MDD3700786.1 RIP metalloprotease RseP [Bacteroidales bacterium]MDY0370395.1 RIP metalloprotease RseP [Bacteroidales bacterium]
MEILVKIFQLLLSLSIMVIVHELGHFIAAKAFKTRVEKFYLFFNPWFSLFKFHYKGTEYGMGWLPLGGYVKIAGMIDESMDKESLKQEPQSWEFRSKPSWQRLIIMLGGVIMNVVLAFAIYIILLSVYGEQYLPTSEVNKYGIVTDSLGREMGLQNGDRILAVDNTFIEDFNKIPMTLILEEAQTITVDRDGQQLLLQLPEGILGKLIKYQSANFISVGIPFIAAAFHETSVAKDAGLQLGDTIIGINGELFPYFQEFRERIQQYKDQKVEVQVIRQYDTLSLAMQLPENGLIGVYPKSDINDFFELHQKNYSFAKAIPAGMVKTVDGIGNYLKQLRLLFSPQVKAYENVGGFIAIGNIFPAQFHWESFWRLTAFLSIMLAVLNLLPIPALDGGHVMFLIYEIVTRRKPNDRFMEVAQIIGMVLLLSLILFANGNDIIKLFR